MSTWFNEETQKYENFETAIMEQLERIDDVLTTPDEGEEGQT